MLFFSRAATPPLRGRCVWSGKRFAPCFYKGKWGSTSEIVGVHHHHQSKQAVIFGTEITQHFFPWNPWGCISIRVLL